MDCRRSLLQVIAVVVLAFAATTANAQTLIVLHNFKPPSTGCGPTNPVYPGVMTQGRDGNLYSTTRLTICSNGQAGPPGTVFKITPAGTPTVESFFPGSTLANGYWPLSGLTLGADGNFYGTTSACEVSGCNNTGALLKITASGAITSLYDFPGPVSCGTGITTCPLEPDTAPIQGADGNFYGTLHQGGVGCSGFGCGGIYKFVPSTKTLTFLHVFPSTGADGVQPSTPLLQATDGNLYATAAGGSRGFGVIYKISTTGKFSILHNFCLVTNCADGSVPASALIQGKDGFLYGTTANGGTTNGGVLYRISLSGSYKVLHNFCLLSGCTDGGSGGSASNVGYVLLQANDGKLYGIVGGGMQISFHHGGVIFQYDPVSGAYTVPVPVTFDGSNGDRPVALMQHTNGLFYGLTNLGGTAGDGVFYSLDMGLEPFVSFVEGSGKVGATVEIIGQDLSSATAVSFNGTPATTFLAHSETYLTATVPDEATTGLVTVTISSGTLTSNVNFRVTPQITSISPTSGLVGSLVTITGVSLTQTSKVIIGGVSAKFKVDSDTMVTATVPTGAKTGQKITVTTAGGTASSPETFTVTP